MSHLRAWWYVYLLAGGFAAFLVTLASHNAREREFLRACEARCAKRCMYIAGRRTHGQCACDASVTILDCRRHGGEER